MNNNHQMQLDKNCKKPSEAGTILHRIWNNYDHYVCKLKRKIKASFRDF